MRALKGMRVAACMLVKSLRLRVLPRNQSQRRKGTIN
jgi:hypothetical protein